MPHSKKEKKMSDKKQHERVEKKEYSRGMKKHTTMTPNRVRNVKLT